MVHFFARRGIDAAEIEQHLFQPSTAQRNTALLLHVPPNLTIKLPTVRLQSALTGFEHIL
jgi:hypothetical protein